MTDTANPQEALRRIGYRVGNCAGAALGINLINFERGDHDANSAAAISGMASVLERELERIAGEIDDWADAVAKRHSTEGLS